MILQGLRVRDALGMGEGSNPLATPRQLQRQRSLDAAEPAEVVRVFQMWRGLQM